MNEIKPFSLKPCPFCGSEVALTTTPLWHDGHGYHGCFEYSVFCKNCGCCVGGSTCDSVYFSEQEAIEKVVKAWNRRKENEEVVRCKNCVHNQLPPTSGNANCELWYGMTDLNGYCSRGERKEENETS